MCKSFCDSAIGLLSEGKCRRQKTQKKDLGTALAAFCHYLPGFVTVCHFFALFFGTASRLLREIPPVSRRRPEAE